MTVHFDDIAASVGIRQIEHRLVKGPCTLETKKFSDRSLAAAFQSLSSTTVHIYDVAALYKT